MLLVVINATGVDFTPDSGSANERLALLDLFSGAGGMSFGFHARPPFRVVGAMDVIARVPIYVNEDMFGELPDE